MVHNSSVPDPELAGRIHGWRGALFAFCLPFILIAPLVLYSLSQAPAKVTAIGQPGEVGQQFVPARSSRKPHSPRKHRLNCLLETA